MIDMVCALCKICFFFCCCFFCFLYSEKVHIGGFSVAIRRSGNNSPNQESPDEIRRVDRYVITLYILVYSKLTSWTSQSNNLYEMMSTRQQFPKRYLEFSGWYMVVQDASPSRPNL